jgi:hypothetical protein
MSTLSGILSVSGIDTRISAIPLIEVIKYVLNMFVYERRGDEPT